ncbi:hypothetical protein H257_09685 [Aphanomyces astaci]|uniref:FYVE-type domain-containing protein n=1 Tax=Aphanomyces astaci TaxID=112090 RepID=W4G920_APHAT|nr:hypothetical protein H257_09685 [Aphanomyces astaci]ETV76160.1 hypothetical protein H257_09685 [Aphanomyces astaci]|eukprot:XP_009834285.1 hypothetical protein H257_09685 [Aphanomyces astaci]
MKRDTSSITVDVADFRRMQIKAAEAISELSTFGLGETALSLFHSEGDTRVYQRKVAGTPFGELTSTGAMALSMDALGYALYNSTSNDHRTFLGLHYATDYLEGAVLNKSMSRTHDDPFLWLGAKYKKTYLPNTTMFEPRDTTYLEYSASSVDVHGRRRVVFIQDSKVFPTFPPVPEVVRMEFTLMHLFTEVSEGRVEFVTRYVLGSLGKGVPTFLAKKMLLRNLILDPHLPQLVQKRRLLDNSIINSHGGITPVVPTIKDGKCTTCAAKFGAFRSVSHCAACGHGTCKPCRVVVYRALHVKSVNPVVKLCFCKACSIDARLSRSTAPPPRRAKSSSSSGGASRGTDLIEIVEHTTPPHRDYVQQHEHPLQHHQYGGTGPPPRSKQVSSYSNSTNSSSYRRDAGPTAATTEAMDGWMDGEGAPSDAPSTIEAMEMLQHMQTSLEDQKMLLHLMRMRLANRTDQYDASSVLATPSSAGDHPLKGADDGGYP